jgi:hypothetical protein
MLNSVNKYFLYLLVPFLISFSLYEHREVEMKHAFNVTTKDSIVLKVNLAYDSAGLPDYYQCWVESPVCDDGLCKLIALDMYWDLLGNYRRFDVPDGRPLTKWDHLEFTGEDYRKLHDILGDKRSLLGSVSNIDDLFEKDTKKVSETVDAVTGATKETVKKAVVDGAVYSSYTMWHIVHGEISNKIAASIPSMVNEDLLQKFLQSEHYPYQYYALDYLVRHDQVNDYLEELQGMLRRADAFVARTALAKMGEDVYNEKQFQVFLAGWLASAEYYTQEAIFNVLTKAGLYPEVGEILTATPELYNERQLSKIIQIMGAQKSKPSKRTIRNLLNLLDDERKPVAEAAVQALKSISNSDPYTKKILKKYENN